MRTEIVGWVSAIILALTISRQVYTQWKTKSSDGISRWLFIGQITASAGFVWYSALVNNWVFVFTNAYILFMAVAGQGIYLHNKRQASKRRAVSPAKAG